MPLLTSFSSREYVVKKSSSEAFVAPTITPSYAPAAASTVNEGSGISITLNTTEIPDNAGIFVSVTGVTAADYSTTATSPITVTNNSATVNFILNEDLTTEGSETFTFTYSYTYTHPVDGSTTITGTASWTVGDSSTTPPDPTYVLGTNKATVNEGSSVTITLTTANVSAGTTVAYTITGASSADLNGASLTGNFLTGTTDSVSLIVAADATTEGAENIIVTLDNGEDTITVPINDTSQNPTFALTTPQSSVNEGDTFIVFLVTTDIANGTTLPYTITGVTPADIDNENLTGNFVVQNNAAQLSVVVTADASLSEGAETFQLVLNNGAGGTVQVTINDSSVNTTPAYLNLTLQTPSTINEGQTSTFRITGRNIAQGTTIDYVITTVSGTMSASDFVPAALTRTVTWAPTLDNVSQTQDFTVTLAEDTLTEGTESFKVVLAATDSASTSTGSIESPTVTISDTSLTPETGQIAFTSNASWTVPTGVFSISMVAIAGGGGGGGVYSSGARSGSGGAGGELRYANDVTVTPGEVLTIATGAAGLAGARNANGQDGGASSVLRQSTTLLSAIGGGAGVFGGGGAGGTGGTGDGAQVGGNGGAGGNYQAGSRGGGGGGAGGYSGVGGAGANGSSFTPGGNGGGGGAGGAGSSNTTTGPGQSGGGGVGLLGQGTDGTGGNYNSDGGGGSSGQEGQNGIGGEYGGGGSGTRYSGNPSLGLAQNGGPGAIRIIWPGAGRQYPTTRTADENVVVGTYDNITGNVSSIAEGGTAVTFTLSTTDVQQNTTVGYSIVSVSGTVNMDDFSSATSTFIIDASGNATVQLIASTDFATEGTESFKIQLAATDSIGTDTGDLESPTITITDASVATVYNGISLNKSTYNEGETITITVNHTQANTSASFTVPYTIAASGSATDDFSQTSGTLTLMNGATSETTKTVISNDLTTEGTETLTVTLGSSDSNGNSTGGISATATITDTSIAARIPGQGLVGFIDQPGYNVNFGGSGNNPEGTDLALADQDWGYSLGGTDDYIIVGASQARDAAGAGGNVGVGQAFIYNAQNQNPINLLDNPYKGNSSLLERKSRFGAGVGIGSDSAGNLYAAVLCSHYQYPGNSLYDPKIIVYKSTNGFATVTLHKIVSYGDPQSFGQRPATFQFSVHKDLCAIGTNEGGSNNSGSIRYFQLSSSSTSTTVCQQTSNYEVGACVDINDDTNLIFGGAPDHGFTQGPTTYTNVGLTQVFGTGNLPQTFVVTANGSSAYLIDGVSKATITLTEGGIYTFDQSDSSNSNHPFRFSETANNSGGSEYTTGVVVQGTPGQAGAKTTITVANGAPTLYYYCAVHYGMGGQANTPTISYRLTQGRTYASTTNNYNGYFYGESIADAGAYYAVGSGGDDYTVSGSGSFIDIGRIRFFNTSNGYLVGTANNPIPYNRTPADPSGSIYSTGNYAVAMMRGNHDGYVACVWRDAYNVQDSILKVYDASDSSELYSINNPGSVQVGLQTWTLTWQQHLHLTDEHLFLVAKTSSGAIPRVYIY